MVIGTVLKDNLLNTRRIITSNHNNVSHINPPSVSRINLLRAMLIKGRVDPIILNNAPSLCNEYGTVFFFDIFVTVEEFSTF